MRTRPRNDWDDADWFAPIGPIPAPSECYVDEDKTDRIPFGFQQPAPRPAPTRAPGRQARVARLRRGIR